MPGLRILACQVDIPPMTTPAERDRHLDRVAAKIREHLQRRPHDVVVLPELSSIDYARASFDNLHILAEPLDGPSFQRFGGLAREFGVVIVYGMARRSADCYRISQIAAGPGAEPIGYFDKLHIAQFGDSMERDYFTGGDHLFIFEHRGVTIAPIVCYDIRMPELTRRLAVDHGVQLVLHCAAHGRDETFYSLHHFSVARAIENQVYFLTLNRAGEHYGSSLLCPPWIDENHPPLHFPPAAETFKAIEIDTALIESVRKNYPLLRDRIGDYSSICLRRGRRLRP